MNFESFKAEASNTEQMNIHGDNNMSNMSYSCKESCCEMPMMPPMGGCCCPVYECPRENVCHRYICYDVPHIMPINTRVINHHVYRHSYQPQYTTCEENVVENMCCNNHCGM